MKTYYFDSGLPRSGSTLLTALLNQNPLIHAGPLSPVFEVMYYTRNRLRGEQAQAHPKPKIFKKMVENVIDTYYEDRSEPVVIDKCRAWTAHIDLIKEYITPDPKIICTVRHPLDILASFIDLINNSRSVSFIDKALLRQNMFITNDTRCNLMMNPGGIVWESMNALATAFRNNQTQHIHFIQYDDLVNDPKRVMQGIHSFLRMKPYEYDFDNVENKYREKDTEVYGLPTMHEVRSKVEKKSRHYSEVLSEEVINKYKDLDFWNKQ
jgi:sulfotransferase